MIVGYARVSSVDQNLERQLENLKHLVLKKFLQKTIRSIYRKQTRLSRSIELCENGRSFCRGIN